MKILLFVNAAVFTEAFHASPRAWIKHRATAPRGGRVLRAGEDEYGDIMSKLESSMDSVGTAVKTQVVVPPTSLDSPAPVSLPKVELPPAAVTETPKVELEMPKVDMPKVELPSFAMPKFELPKVDVPKVELELPSVEMPKVDLELPEVEIPNLDSLELPSVDIPKVELSIPEMSMPSVELPSVGDLDLGSILGGGDVLPIAVGGLALLAALAAFAGGGGGDEVASPTTGSGSATAPSVGADEMFFASSEVDLSIPYDAAAKLAYEEAGKPGDYAVFKKKYEEDTVAMIKAKQKSRQQA